jgi:hypothetical protein
MAVIEEVIMPPMEGDATGTVSVASAVSDEPRATVLKEEG